MIPVPAVAARSTKNVAEETSELNTVIIGRTKI